ncbi:MAG TPA: hypothetical protein VG013_02570, partial [Gemmataceae bacterium]|nr:hypothetical protein [Gemmataceae bacterium]
MDEFVADWQALAQCASLVEQKAGLDALYRRYHEHVLHVVAARLGEEAVKQDLVDDLAQQVWLRLSGTEELLLLKYGDYRGSLRGFLGLLARWEVQLYHRKVHRQKPRQVPLRGHDAPDPRVELGILQAAWEEFLARRSARDREFVQTESQAGRTDRERSRANQRRMERLVEKWL